jgi:chorismate mutase/prephenate dehydratase
MPKAKSSSTKSSSKADSAYPQKLAALDQSLLHLAEQRVELLRRWALESRALESNGDSKTAGAPPPIWEQISTASEATKDLAIESRLPKGLANELLRAMVGVTNYAASAQTQIAYLGPLYSYSYLAAVKHFSESAALDPVSSIAAVFEAILRNQATYGVVPIENSTDGRIVDTLTMFAKHPVKICGEVMLPIHHCLLSRTPRQDIREVYSKPQALSQCRYWLSQNLPEARVVEISSTTRAAQVAAEKNGAAAIASREAGAHYGLNVIADCIEDNPDNSTRFAVLCNPAADRNGVSKAGPARTGKDKTSVMFQIPHQSGALAEAMLIFSKAKLNMTWIESFPIPGNASEYLFFIELEGHQADKNVASALAALSKKTLRIELLGSYPRAAVGS